jgi:hypothetical protein
MEHFTEIEDNKIALHQQIREFVEREIADSYVTKIYETSTTEYEFPPDSITMTGKVKQAPILSLVRMSFHVQGWNLEGDMTCDVVVRSDGALIMTNRGQSTFYPSFGKRRKRS